MLEGAEKEGLDPKAFVKQWRTRLEKVLKDLETGALDLKHPFNWGAFVMVGYGGMALRSTAQIECDMGHPVLPE